MLDAVLANAPVSIGLRVPRALELRAAPAQRPRAWTERAMFDVPVVLGRSAVRRDDLARLAPRSVVTLDRVHARPSASQPAIAQAELVVFGGAIGVAIAPGAVVAAVTTSYSARSMALPDDAHVELTVGLGTTQLSLRQIIDLAVGQVVPLGRPLAGPFEIRAAGKLVGRGELVAVDGELGVRVVSLEE
jgi:flagellar motor switch/type III secretory pathway protein FliN